MKILLKKYFEVMFKRIQRMMHLKTKSGLSAFSFSIVRSRSSSHPIRCQYLTTSRKLVVDLVCSWVLASSQWLNSFIGSCFAFALPFKTNTRLLLHNYIKRWLESNVWLYICFTFSFLLKLIYLFCFLCNVTENC